MSDRELYERIVHGLRTQGWPRIDAECEALDRLERNPPNPLEHGEVE